jgi:hypothetical protein
MEANKVNSDSDCSRSTYLFDFDNTRQTEQKREVFDKGITV